MTRKQLDAAITKAVAEGAHVGAIAVQDETWRLLDGTGTYKGIPVRRTMEPGHGFNLELHEG